MTSDFYCDEVLSGNTTVQIVAETDRVLAYHHTRPYWPVHIVVIPKQHVPSLTDLGSASDELLHEIPGASSIVPSSLMFASMSPARSNDSLDSSTDINASSKMESTDFPSEAV